MARIVGLEVENFKRIKAVDIQVEGNKVVLAGKNAQGKSSVLDAIFYAIGGRAGSVDRPVRDGESKAEVTVTLDDIVVTRTTSSAGRSKLEVKARDGNAKFTKPQQVLDSLIGKLSFDPLAFAEADAKKQLEMLRSVVDLDVDLDALAARRKEVYEQRTDVNRDVKRLRTVVDEYDGPTDLPEVDVDAAIEQASTLREHRRRKDELRASWEHNAAEIKRLEELNQAIIKEANELPDVSDADLEAAQDAYAAAVAGQASRGLVERHQADRRELEEAELNAQDCNVKLAELDDERSRALASANFPIEGLSFGDEGVLWNDVPFSQASSAERIRVSVAMAMALNPDLRVILIENASLLDSDMLATIQGLADEKDYQIWYEVVGDDVEGATVVIEDGGVKA